MQYTFIFKTGVLQITKLKAVTFTEVIQRHVFSDGEGFLWCALLTAIFVNNLKGASPKCSTLL
jgi:uncharacterized protein YhfF